MKNIKIAILGLGTVGGGTYQILKENRELIAARCGCTFEVAKVLERDHALWRLWASIRPSRSPTRSSFLTTRRSASW